MEPGQAEAAPIPAPEGGGESDYKEEKEQKAQLELGHAMRLRSNRSDSPRPPAYRKPRKGSGYKVPQDQRNTDPDWKKALQALGKEGSGPEGIQPDGGWDLDTTKLASKHGIYFVIGNGCVLHHPECPQLRGYGTVFWSNVYMVPPFYADSPILGYRFPAQFGCCFGRWERLKKSPGKK